MLDNDRSIAYRVDFGPGSDTDLCVLLARAVVEGSLFVIPLLNSPK